MTLTWQQKLAQLDTEELPNCILCEEFAGKPDFRWCQYLALPDSFGVLRCPSCNLLWLSPRPNAQGYRELYTYELYFGGDVGTPENYPQIIAKRIDYFKKRIRKAVRLLNRGEMNILDYGAATGDFVHLARSEGHGCDGIEVSADARATAKQRFGLNLLSPEQATELDASQYDLIHMNHVLEHMPDPLAHLQWCARLLKLGGIIIIEVPQQFENDLDRVRRWVRHGGKQLCLDAYSLHHTFFFTPDTMLDLLDRAGFKSRDLTTFNPDKAPLWPFKINNWVLRAWLQVSDRLHSGGNIIEVYAMHK